jgi:transcriptional activator HAC1
MELQLANERAKRLEAERELELVRAGNGTDMTVFRGSSPAQSEQFRQPQTPITFSQELFGSRDAPTQSISSQYTIESKASLQTVNPASLSPEIRPVQDSNASFSDMTQHPAAMLCDLQCQSEGQRPWTSTMISQVLTYLMVITQLTSTAYSTLLNPTNPMSQIINSLTTRSSLSPTPSILRMIIWLTTTTTILTTSTSMTSSTMTNTTSPRPRFSLRIRLLNQLLACSPNLARPLMDATMAVMRLASEQQLTHDCLTGVGSSDRIDGRESPSLESLMTLLWATKVFMKRSNTEQVGRRDSRELDNLFSSREVMGMGTRGISFISDRGSGLKKSLGEWRSGAP